MIGELKNPAVSIDLTRPEMGSVQGGAQRSSLGRSKRSGDHKGLGGEVSFCRVVDVQEYQRRRQVIAEGHGELYLGWKLEYAFNMRRRSQEKGSNWK